MPFKFDQNKTVGKFKTKPVFCVGIKTKELLESHGFTVVLFGLRI
jgi:uroporphyrinogen-III synthase